MKITQVFGKEDLATVFVGETSKGRIEFVESLQPPFSREEKWVLIISSLYGCPIECKMCDAGGCYNGKLTTKEILEQIDYLVSLYYPDCNVTSDKFKIQFARVGEPAFNPNVLEVLKLLPHIYNAPGLMPSLSTVAPSGCDDFFKNLLEIKNNYYPENFQLQFSLHTTDESERDKIIPSKKWSFEKIAEYGEEFHRSGGRKITLNFILADSFKIDPAILAATFSPEIFFIKMTPLNPTCRAIASGLKCSLQVDVRPRLKEPAIATSLKKMGYDVLVSIGEPEENSIGSNCGQYLATYEEHSKRGTVPENSYKLQNYLID
jgi:23S rRNA (adenine2503-C2)-methyltransferase